MYGMTAHQQALLSCQDLLARPGRPSRRSSGCFACEVSCDRQDTAITTCTLKNVTLGLGQIVYIRWPLRRLQLNFSHQHSPSKPFNNHLLEPPAPITTPNTQQLLTSLSNTIQHNVCPYFVSIPFCFISSSLPSMAQSQHQWSPHTD